MTNLPADFPDTSLAASGLSSAHITAPLPFPPGTARVTYAEGGRSCRIQLSTRNVRRGPGGRRQSIYDFSRSSQNRLRHALASVNVNALLQNATYSVTLTYPADFPLDPAIWHNHRDKFRDRFRRKWRDFAACWRLEFQERGAPHYHLIVIGDNVSDEFLALFRDWCADTWTEVVASGDINHPVAGTRVDRIRSWIASTAYVSKPPERVVPTFTNEETGEILPIGRFWGVWGKLPIDRRIITITEDAAFRIRRVLRRYLGWKSRSRRAGISCCVPEAVVERLVEWARGLENTSPDTYDE